MSVPNSVTDLDPVASNNSPAGSEPIGQNLDEYLRAHAAIIRQVSDASNVGTQTHAATSKATPVDADELPLSDSGASFALKKISWANLKAAIKTFLQGGMAMTGVLSLAADPANPLEAATKQYVDVSGAQIQPIDSAVAANALTLKINPTKLDFRSSTLTDGTINRRTIAAQLSITVPSGATLGTINGQSARIAVLAIDNAGTVEAAVVNLAGGVNLDEATLISTTAISGSSNSASVIYSTTARTNVAFRVVGFIDITETTAGTWAADATRKQGSGGLATAGWNSLGYGQVWQDVTGSRAAGTTYYNTGSKPKTIRVRSISANAGLTTTINGVSLGLNSNNNTAAYVIEEHIIPAYASYSVGVSVGAINTWHELN